LADALEAIFGAAYIDGGLKAVEKIFARIILPDLPGAQESIPTNPKGALQEILQRQFGLNPRYTVIEETGPLHDRHFTVEVSWASGPTARGMASSKRQAEVEAAAEALRQISGDFPST
jgi:ribonuclease-3